MLISQGNNPWIFIRRTFVVGTYEWDQFDVAERTNKVSAGLCGKQRRWNAMAYYPKHYDRANRRGLGPDICYSEIHWLHWKPEINIIPHDNRWLPRWALSWSFYKELWLHWTKDDATPDDSAASFVRLWDSSFTLTEKSHLNVMTYPTWISWK